MEYICDMNMIILENISKMYRIYKAPRDKLKEALIRSLFKSRRSFHRPFWALQDINLEIKEGTTLGIIGQNGSGKSTLLQIITGILQPTTGNLEVQGRVAALLELGAGFNKEFTGRENIFMKGSIMGIPRKEMKKRFDQIAEFADIGDFIDQPVRMYSSGMYVRLAFAGAVHVDPDILIVDEALAVGDTMFKSRCYKKMEEIQKRGKTILFVTHDIQTVKTFCNRAILLDQGRVISEGDPNTVVNEYSKLLSVREEAYLMRTSRKLMAEKVRFERTPETSSEYRYGSGDADITDFKIVDDEGNPAMVLEHGKTYTIRSTAKFHRSVKDPVMGMVIKTIKGYDVTAVSTHSANVPIGPVEIEMEVTTEFSQKICLNPGEYTLSVGVSENTETHIRPFDRRREVLAFKVVGKSKSFGQIDMGTTVKVVEKNIVTEPLSNFSSSLPLDGKGKGRVK